MISAISAIAIILKSSEKDKTIMIIAFVVAILSVFGATYCFIGYGCGVDIKFNLNDGSTYLAKSVTYYNEGDGVRLDFQEIDVATNETIGPEFLYWRAVGVSEAPTVVKNGDIMIYQNGKMRHWVSPF